MIVVGYITIIKESFIQGLLFENHNHIMWMIIKT